ncbi:hypothetical protein [Acidicapsa acidisoli]|uniref:hypothetical protein n=1 Tax=Acidicapsa acidisoli TaxID=1615681 RepID=UPI0021DFF6A9|nr:hypothetical protein [Acidicapsa acidisoli]
MKNKLQLTPKTFCLSCTWVATSDTKKPLICVWSLPKTSQSVLTTSATEDAERIPLCA